MELGGELYPKKRQVTLKDGRYMIFYTFEVEPAPAPEHEKAGITKPKPQSKEEHCV